MANVFDFAQIGAAFALIVANIWGCLATSSPLRVELVNVTGSQAYITWSGLQMDSMDFCQITHGLNGTTEYEMEKRPLTSEVEPVYLLDSLEENKVYVVNVECTDKEAVPHRLPTFTFSTDMHGRSTSSPPSPRVPPPQHPLSNGGGHGEEVVIEENLTHTPTDIALGVMLGITGAAIVIGMTYYIVTKYRRNLRFRRLLQYRQQDSDPFAEADGDSEQ